MSMQNMNETHWIFSKKKFLEAEKLKESSETWLDKCDGKPVELFDKKSGLCYVEHESGMTITYLIDKAWCEKVEQNE